jgi:hypothetical protein
MIVWSSEAEFACHPATLHYSKSSSTLFVRLPQARQLLSIRGPMIPPMLPPDGWRPVVGLYSRPAGLLSWLTRPHNRESVLIG